MLVPRTTTLARRRIMLSHKRLGQGAKFLAGVGISFGVGFALPTLLNTPAGATAGAGFVLLGAGVLVVRKNERAAAFARRSVLGKALAKTMYRIAHVQDSPPAVRGAALAICGAMNQKQWLRDDVDLLRPDLTTLLHGRNACAAAKRAAGDLERTGADASALPHGEPLLCLGPAEQMEEHAGEGNRWVEARFHVFFEGDNGAMLHFGKPLEARSTGGEAAGTRVPADVIGEELARRVAEEQAAPPSAHRADDAGAERRADFPAFGQELSGATARTEVESGLMLAVTADGTTRTVHLIGARLVWKGGEAPLL